MIAWAQERDERAGDRAHPAREKDRGFGALESGDTSLHDLGVRGVSITRVAKSAARSEGLNEVDRLNERMDDRGVDFAFFVAPMNREGREIDRFLLSSAHGRLLSRAPSDDARANRDPV